MPSSFLIWDCTARHGNPELSPGAGASPPSSIQEKYPFKAKSMHSRRGDRDQVGGKNVRKGTLNYYYLPLRVYQHGSGEGVWHGCRYFFEQGLNPVFIDWVYISATVLKLGIQSRTVPLWFLLLVFFCWLNLQTYDYKYIILKSSFKLVFLWLIIFLMSACTVL